MTMFTRKRKYKELCETQTADLLKAVQSKECLQVVQILDGWRGPSLSDIDAWTKMLEVAAIEEKSELYDVIFPHLKELFTSHKCDPVAFQECLHKVIRLKSENGVSRLLKLLGKCFKLNEALYVAAECGVNSIFVMLKNEKTEHFKKMMGNIGQRTKLLKNSILGDCSSIVKFILHSFITPKVKSLGNLEDHPLDHVKSEQVRDLLLAYGHHIVGLNPNVPWSPQAEELKSAVLTGECSKLIEILDKWKGSMISYHGIWATILKTRELRLRLNLKVSFQLDISTCTLLFVKKIMLFQ